MELITSEQRDELITTFVERDSDNGSVQGHEIVTDRAVVADCVRIRDQLWGAAIPHSEYEPVW